MDEATRELFGRTLRQLRSQAKLSQPQLARQIPVSQATLSRYESGKQSVDPAIAARLDDLLGAGGALRILRESDRQRASEVLPSGVGREGWQGLLVARSAERARAFLSVAEERNVGNETVHQLADDIRRLVRAYQTQPLESLLQDISEVQSRAFNFLEGRQRPSLTRDLYLMAGVASGLMAKASHDLGAPHEALTHARASYTCADNADHNGLRTWTRGLQAVITYWSGRLDESLRYAQQAADSASRSTGTSAIWLAANEARVLAALGRSSDARQVLARATVARESVQFDELDELGGLCTFNRPRQLYYAADAMRWCGRAEAEETQRLAIEALEAYENATDDERAFGDEAGVSCALAVARIELGEIEGATDALADVLGLPASKRIHGIVSSASFVHQSLMRSNDTSPKALDLAEALHDFSSTRLAIPS